MSPPTYKHHRSSSRRAVGQRARDRGIVLDKPVMEYSIQQVSEMLGIPIQKLRRWDETGVLTAARTEGGHRRYSKELIDRLADTGLAAGGGKASKELAEIRKSLAEKHRIIQLLLDSENRYRDLVETSHDLIWTTDAQGRFTYLNGAAHDVFGLGPKDLIGRCFFDFEAGGAHISNRRFLALLRRHGEVKNYVTHAVTARRGKARTRWGDSPGQARHGVQHSASV